MTDFFRVILFVIVLGIAFGCYFLVVGSLFEKRITKTINVARLMPGRSFGIGLVNFLFFGSIVLMLFAFSEGVNGNVAKFILLLPALVLTAILVTLLSFGLAAMIQIISEQVFPDHSAWKKTFWGTIVLAFGSAIPAIGWFLLFPYVALTGFGAVILGFFQRAQ